MQKKKMDIFVLVLFLIVGILFTNFTKGMYIGKSVFSGLVFCIVPVIYLSLREKKNWKKIIIAALVFGTIFGFIFEFVAEFNSAYLVVSVLTPYKIFGVLPVDNIIGHMMMTMLTIVFYEHFIDRETNVHISKNLKFAILPAFFVVIFILFAYFFDQNLIKFGHPYLYMGLVAIITPIYLGITQPKFIKNMTETAIYFFILYFVIEILAVQNQYWIYPGNNYVGWVNVFGVSFPFEELFFWMLFYAATLVSYYELFVDTNTN